MSRYQDMERAELIHRLEELDRRQDPHTPGRADRLNALLRTVASINQLIARHEDGQELLQAVCLKLASTPEPANAWAATVDEERNITFVAHAGTSDALPQLQDHLTNKGHPECVAKLLHEDTEDVYFQKDPAERCHDCPLGRSYQGRAGLAARMASGGRVFGVLGLAVPADWGTDTEHRALLTELAGDLGAGLARIEAHRQAEASRQLNQADRAFLQGILDSISDAFFTLEGPDLTVAYFNKAAEDVLNKKADLVVGKPLFDAFPEARGSLFEQNYRHAYVIKERLDFEAYFPPHEQWYDVRVYPQPDGLSVYFQVSTERKESEQALRESERRYRLLAENTLDIIWEMRLDRTYTFVNAAVQSVLGYTPEEFVHSDAADYFPPEEVQRLEAKTAELVRRKQATGVVVESQMRHRDGHLVPVEVHGRVVFDEQGKPLYAQGVTRDITARKQAQQQQESLEAQIQHAQKLESLGVLAGGIAHDFNNLLVGILGNADLALADLSPYSPVRASVIDIEHAARRAADLCRQMLAYSGKGKFIVEPLDISAVVEEMSHMLEVSISKRAVLKFNFGQSLPPIEADATQMRQVIMNLITNASEALEEKSGIVSITTGALEADEQYLTETYLDSDLKPGLYVTLEVADTGCGMDKETLAKLFDPFFTTKFTGRGLGLAAVLGIVRGHGGGIKVYSEPGKGTTFKILLPAAEAPASAPEDTTAQQPSHRAEGEILLVDDEETVRAVAKRMLQKIGYAVTTASDGRQAVQIAQEDPQRFCCIVMDLTMPHMDGEEAVRALRRVAPAVPVIMTSGYNEQEVSQRFIGKGLAGFIQKPFRIDSLSASLAEVLTSQD